jgi:hypothetical protein
MGRGLLLHVSTKLELCVASAFSQERNQFMIAEAHKALEGENVPKFKV